MAHWIYVEEGSYLVDAAFLLTPAYSGVALEDAIMEVYLDGRQERRVRGYALARNILIVELLEDYDDLDLLLDLGDRFRYLVKAPVIKAGKVFAPDVKSRIHFAAQSPVQKLSDEEYREIRSRLALIDL